MQIVDFVIKRSTKPLKELEFKGESNKVRYVVLKNATHVISLLDKLNIPRLVSQHLLMCAKKPSP